MPPWRRCSRLPDVLVSLAEGPPGRADLARHRAITLQAGSHTGGPGTRSGPLLAIAAGQAARNGLCRPPVDDPTPQQIEAAGERAATLFLEELGADLSPGRAPGGCPWRCPRRARGPAPPRPAGPVHGRGR